MILSVLKRLLILVGFLVFSCNEPSEEIQEVDRGYEYYPLQVGLERTYRVMRIDYFLGIDSATGIPETVADTSRFLLMERISGTDEGLPGQVFFLEHSFSKSDTSFPWSLIPDSIYKVQNNEVYLNKTRNNRTTTELRFPVQHGASWDGNAFNSDPNQIFIVDSTGFSVLLDSIQYSDCIRVTKSDIENPIERDKRFDIYSRWNGPVYRFMSVLKYKQPIDPNATGLERINKGYEEIWVAIDD